jgi:hypothetical protein
MPVQRWTNVLLVGFFPSMVLVMIVPYVGTWQDALFLLPALLFVGLISTAGGVSREMAGLSNSSSRESADVIDSRHPPIKQHGEVSRR